MRKFRQRPRNVPRLNLTKHPVNRLRNAFLSGSYRIPALLHLRIEGKRPTNGANLSREIVAPDETFLEFLRLYW
jgi:hypothetical protein